MMTNKKIILLILLIAGCLTLATGCGVGDDTGETRGCVTLDEYCDSLAPRSSICTCEIDCVNDLCSLAGEIDGYLGDLCHYQELYWYGRFGPACPELCCPSDWKCEDGRCYPPDQPDYCAQIEAPAAPAREAICDDALRENGDDLPFWKGKVSETEITPGDAGVYDTFRISLSVTGSDTDCLFTFPFPAGAASPFSDGQTIRVYVSREEFNYYTPDYAVEDEVGQLLALKAYFLTIGGSYGGSYYELQKRGFTARFGRSNLCIPVPIDPGPHYQQIQSLDVIKDDVILKALVQGEQAEVVIDNVSWILANVEAIKLIYGGDCEFGCGRYSAILVRQSLR
jgi:hypothetical protein